MWKVVAAILNRRLAASITFHDFLRGFWAGRGTGTATLEAKLLQQLAALREEVLYVIFLDLQKAYDALDRFGCLEILEGYGLGPLATIVIFPQYTRSSQRARGTTPYPSRISSHLDLSKVSYALCRSRKITYRTSSLKAASC